jgi:seryl-tRNA synthetase
MLDIRFIRENAELVEKSAAQKGYKVNVQKLLSLDENRRKLLSEIEKIRAEAVEQGKKLKDSLAQLESQLSPVNGEYEKLLKDVPNVIPEDTPEGGEEDNIEVKKWGDTSDKGFKVIDHVAWADSQKRELLDFTRGAKVAGHKFYYLEGSLVELELALTQFGFQMAKEYEMDGKHNFKPMVVPHLVNTRITEGAGFSAKGEERQIYKIEGEDLNLIATAEIPLTGFHADETMFRVPRLYAGFSPSYRVEAGAYGKHAKGLYRVHQFNKLELYAFCKPEQSEEFHQKMLNLEEDFCKALEIPYRVVRIAAGDLGAPAYKKFDIEYYSPVDKTYRELMSCSNVTDYQARRLNIKYKKTDGSTEYVHTLNATLAAMSRLIIAIIENFQDKEGKVSIPKILQPYMHGQTHL